MKSKIILFALISILISNKSFSQTLTFTFIKSCVTYERPAFTEDIAKKKFYIVEESTKKTTNKLMEGATFYCNEKERELGYSEIDVLSLINGAKKITEITITGASLTLYV